MKRAGPALALIAGLLVIAALLALGTWQVQRLAWKQALIAQVDARIHADPVPAPETAQQDATYTPVIANGRFVPDASTLVQAVTERGSGYWVLSPLRSGDGRIIFVNRGFVPKRSIPAAPEGDQSITGLLRMSEPNGGFLRTNDPAADRWYSRDIPAIAAKRGLTDVAPYFIDAEAGAETPGQPIGGLTVIAFPNNHLVYAITWYILAAMAAAALVYTIRTRRRDGARDDTA